MINKTQRQPRVTRTLGAISDEPIFGYEIITAAQRLAREFQNEDGTKIADDSFGKRSWEAKIRAKGEVPSPNFAKNIQIVVWPDMSEERQFFNNRIDPKAEYWSSNDKKGIAIGSTGYAEMAIANLEEHIASYDIWAVQYADVLRQVVSERPLQNTDPEEKAQEHFYMYRHVRDVGEVTGEEILSAARNMSGWNREVNIAMTSVEDGMRQFGAEVKWKRKIWRLNYSLTHFGDLRDFEVVVKTEGEHFTGDIIELDKTYCTDADHEEVALVSNSYLGDNIYSPGYMVEKFESSVKAFTKELERITRR